MLELILIAAILVLDQVSKYLIQIYLSPVGASLPLIDGVFELANVHNVGAAWGMMQGFRWLFIPLTIVVAAALVYLMIRYRTKLSIFSRITLALLFAGSVGNLIDRIAFSYVRDFFYFSLINFPVFNIADSSLTIGCIFLVIDALFLKQKSMFERISVKPERQKKDEPSGGERA